MPVCLCPVCDQVFFTETANPERERCSACAGALRPLDEAEAQERAQRQDGDPPPPRWPAFDGSAAEAD
jgi:hypothetical protein